MANDVKLPLVTLDRPSFSSVWCKTCDALIANYTEHVRSETTMKMTNVKFHLHLTSTSFDSIKSKMLENPQVPQICRSPNCLETKHVHLSQVPGTLQHYNHGQRLVSPRPAKPYSEIYPGPRVISNIDELTGQEMIQDPRTGQMRKAFRVHVCDREMDDWVWAEDLKMDRRYKKMVIMFEDSIAGFWEKVVRDCEVGWKGCKSVLKNPFSKRTINEGRKKRLSWVEKDGETVILFI